jgi:hypothetical protein
MTQEEYEKNKENMMPWECDNGHVYMAFKNACVFCEHCDVFWDYTNGPYMFLCDADRNTEHGLSGQCEMFKALEQKVEE